MVSTLGHLVRGESELFPGIAKLTQCFWTFYLGTDQTEQYLSPGQEIPYDSAALFPDGEICVLRTKLEKRIFLFSLRGTLINSKQQQ